VREKLVDEIPIVRAFAVVQERLECDTDDDTHVRFVLTLDPAELFAVSLLSHHDCLKRNDGQAKSHQVLGFIDSAWFWLEFLLMSVGGFCRQLLVSSSLACLP
jgi:hypothetical protein